MERQRKFLLVLPVLVLPFLTMAFWALGGGRKSVQPVITRGIDTQLPQAQFNKKDVRSNKLAIYQQSQKDSDNSGVSTAFLKSIGMDKAKSTLDDSAIMKDDQAEQLKVKLAGLNAQLQDAPPAQSSEERAEPQPENIKQLHHMVSRLNRETARPDPEMQQLNKMLDKIQAIQNPGAVEKKPASSEKPKPFRAIPAIIDGKQKVADGAAVKLKLTDTATIKNQLLPKGQEVYGSCQIMNQRLLLNIENIRRGKQIIPVSLTVFSLDGMPGIPAPEAELAGSASSGADNTLQSLQLISMDPSLGAQAAAGGINAAKGLFSKKLKKIRVKLKNEFPVLLKINR